jgi:hypothetical protein
MRPRCLLSLLILCSPVIALAGENAERWYLNPYVGGIVPDKPWGGNGSTVLYGLDIGRSLSAAWSAEFDMNGAALSDRYGAGPIGLYGGALTLLRVFNRGARFAPYVSFGVGLTHVAPPSAIPLERRTEFTAQPGVGALVRVWERADGSRAVALRPDVKVRWTHGWAHAPGNPVDILYVLGLTFEF